MVFLLIARSVTSYRHFYQKEIRDRPQAGEKRRSGHALHAKKPET